jgi:uncharacterized protein YjbI with pentapeptide repeats
MERVDITDEHFDTIDFTKALLALGDYENCTFINCNFSNASLYNFVFADCTFIDCNISLANLANTILRDIQFKGCKLLGLHFEYCKPMLFKVDFDNCILNLSSFYKLNLKQTKFINCSMQEVDLTEVDMSHSLFDNCDLHAAVFDNSILEKADLRTAFNYSIDPEKNKIKKAKFSLQGVIGLLAKYDIEIV